MQAVGIVIAAYLAAILLVMGVIHSALRPDNQPLYDTLKDFQNLIGGALGIGSIAITALIGSALARAQHITEDRDQRAALSKAFAVEMRAYDLLLKDVAEAIGTESFPAKMSTQELDAWHGHTSLPPNILYQNAAAQLGSLTPGLAGRITACALAREAIKLNFVVPPQNDVAKAELLQQIGITISVCDKAITTYTSGERQTAE